MNDVAAFALLLVLGAGCASVARQGLTTSQEAELRQALLQQDEAAVRTVIEQRTKFPEDSFLLDLLIPDERTAGEPCRTRLVRYLLEKGARPSFREHQEPGGEKGYRYRTDNLRSALRSGCSEILGQLLPRATDQTVLEAIHSARAAYDVMKARRNYSTCTSRMIEHGDFLKALLLIEGHIHGRQAEERSSSHYLAQNALTEIKTRIEQDRFEAQQCTARETAEEAEHRARAEAETRARLYAESPDGIAERACSALREIAESDRMIAEQRQIGQASGFVRKDVLYQQGQRKIHFYDELMRLKKEYSSKSGRTFTTDLCTTSGTN